MLSRRGTTPLAVVVLISLGSTLLMSPAQANPWRLPYESQPPFIPIIDLFGTRGSGLILGAAEVLTGLPAPLTIGNATFVPGVELDGASSEAFTRFRGDVLIRRGDLFIGRRAVGETLDNQSAAITQLGAATDQLGQAQELQGLQLQSQAASINQLGAATDQLGQSLQNHSDVLTRHSQVLQRHEVELQRLDQNVQNLGSGVAGSTALAAALTRMPMDLNGAPLACGVGTGGYSSRYAMSLGCSVELTPSLALNGGGAYLFGGGANYGGGSLSNVAGALGLVYRFGPQGGAAGGQALTQRLQQDLALTKDVNAVMAAELQRLTERLERLEQVARHP